MTASGAWNEAEPKPLTIYTRAFDTKRPLCQLNALNTDMKNVWFGALGRGMYQGGVVVGWGLGGESSELTGRELCEV